MDQIKIGRFIASLRKEKGMTQSDLASKIGVTDRAVSKWENGRGMPDISLIQDLCKELSVSVNELLCGEKLSDDEIEIRAEENIVSSLKMNFKNIKHKRIITVFLILMIFTLGMVCCYSVDIVRMKNNKPVVFSTWGFDYAPPIDLNDELIEIAIKNHIMSRGDNEKKFETEKTFATIKTYLIEEIEKEKYYFYTWVLCKRMYVEDNNVLESGSYSMPSRFYVEKQGEDYIVLKEDYIKDGNYQEDIENIFPQSVISDMDRFYYNGDYEKLELEINYMIDLYFLNKISY